VTTVTRDPPRGYMGRGIGYTAVMSIQVGELIERLSDLPSDWKAEATRAGGSIEVWEPGGIRYGYVFTGARSTRFLTDRRRERETSE
jgi:hypothetical protein